MSSLEKLKSTENLSDLAELLGFTPKGLSYVLYKIKSSEKYSIFEIPKKAGGTRTIKAPVKRLLLLQKRLCELLSQCVSEVQRERPRYWMSSHGFCQGRTIVSNAEVHRRSRFVFNVDIEDFFGAINFGRVRGFFIKDRTFSLRPTIATLIAQIACHENALPQGSPCSPVISNLIGNILDLRLLALAKETHCFYTRYADDLTFSTNEKIFPSKISVNIHDSTWTLGKKLESEIEGAGFTINQTKTRMSLRRSRQTVTGLVVNDKPNINKDYYRTVRAMCNEVFQRGSYYRPVFNGESAPDRLDDLNPLQGMLSHLYFVKARKDRPAKLNKQATDAGELFIPKSPIELYRKFLFFKCFVVPRAPLIVTEGVSDVTYLRCAIRALEKSSPSLTSVRNGKSEILVNFLRPSGTTRDILNIGYGTSGQASLVAQYTKRLEKYAYKPLSHPVIILCDNDKGPKELFRSARVKSGNDLSLNTTEPFYYLGENLYLVKVPEEGTNPREMEDLFAPEWLGMKLDGKHFDRNKEHGDSTAFGKVVFAEKIVRPNADKIDFSSFVELLQRIEASIAHFKTLSIGNDSSGSTSNAANNP